MFAWFKKLTERYKKRTYDLDDYRVDYETWYALPTPEILAPNEIIRYEYVKEIKNYVITVVNGYEHETEIRRLVNVYFSLPDNLRRVIPMHGLKIDDSLFEPSKIYVGKNGNTKIGAIERYLRTLNTLFYGKNSDMSFIDLYLQHYVKDVKVREECMKVARTFNRAIMVDYAKNGRYYEVQAMRNGMVIAYE